MIVLVDMHSYLRVYEVTATPGYRNSCTHLGKTHYCVQRSTWDRSIHMHERDSSESNEVQFISTKFHFLKRVPN